MAMISSTRRFTALAGLVLGWGLATSGTVSAQTTHPAPSANWQGCAATPDTAARLACFDRWAQQQAPTGLPPVTVPAALASTPGNAVTVTALVTPSAVIATASEEGCKDRTYSDLSRFWELEKGTNCGNFSIRGYRPIIFAAVASSSVNSQPTSGAPGHNALTPVDYSKSEARLQLSVRTKVAHNLLTRGNDQANDSLWVGYTQSSYWQLFRSSLSRPFRNTDHEPEVLYVYPTNHALPGGWRLRYSGVGLVHQSNGQAMPLSRSWNRYYLMTGAELNNAFALQARIWRRTHETAATDDNPGISDYIGRAELSGLWNLNKDNTLTATARHSLRSDGRGSVRLEWMRSLGRGDNATDATRVRVHTSLFTGYGDSLIDYNRRRTVLSLGLSLVDW